MSASILARQGKYYVTQGVSPGEAESLNR